MHRLSFIPIALALSFGLACVPPPKHRSWTEFTRTTRDDDPNRRYVESAELEELRANALATRDFMTVADYASTLGLYLWEIDQLLDARDRAASDPEYKYSVPPEYADLDRDARVSEIDGLIDELDAKGDYDPVLDSLLDFARGDCDAVIDEWAREESCHSFPAGYYADSVRATCGEEGVPKLCRVTLDRMADADQKYRLMKFCNETMSKGNPKSREHLATWATPEELEFYDKMVIRGEAKADDLYARAMMAKASANAENERRMDDYAQERSEYDANRPAIEQQSQIGSLDGSDRAPAAPVLITSVGVPLPDDDDGTQIPTDTVSLVLTNECESDIAYQLGHSMLDSENPRTLLPAKEPLTLELPRCAIVDLYRGLDSPSIRARIRMTRGWTVVLKSDCETFGYQREK